MSLANELNELFEHHKKDLESLLFNEGQPIDTFAAHNTMVEKFGTPKVLNSERIGGEYDVEQMVLSFSNRPNELVAINGHYSSWDGTDWSFSKFYDVEATTKVVTVYKRK